MGKEYKNSIHVSETEMINHLTEFIQNCDADELARITGDVFGGKCYWLGEIQEKNSVNNKYDLMYVFEPDENYAGEFGDI